MSFVQHPYSHFLSSSLTVFSHSSTFSYILCSSGDDGRRVTNDRSGNGGLVYSDEEWWCGTVMKSV